VTTTHSGLASDAQGTGIDNPEHRDNRANSKVNQVSNSRDNNSNRDSSQHPSSSARDPPLSQENNRKELPLLPLCL